MASPGPAPKTIIALSSGWLATPAAVDCPQVLQWAVATAARPPPPAIRLAPEMDTRPGPRTRSLQTKLRRGPGSPFCLVEQGYGVCGARDERPHAGQQQQLVDQLVHDVFPQERLRQNHNWEQELWFRDGMAFGCFSAASD